MLCLGIDVGSVSTDLVLTDESGRVIRTLYLKTQGKPVRAVGEGLKELGKEFSSDRVGAVGSTGSGRLLAGALIGADVVKNEITAHGTAAAALDDEIRTVLEIGGQDSKIILLENGLISDFAMNTVCAAGTGSFLDRQAERMGIAVDRIGEYAGRSRTPEDIAGRCAVFAESDMIHKQQMGASEENVIRGMCRALVRNYLSNVAKGKKILPKVCFQGGVAANEGIRAAFEEVLDTEIIVPEHHKVMGAVGAAILAGEAVRNSEKQTGFKGFEIGLLDVGSHDFICDGCSNGCQVMELVSGDRQLGCFGDRCGKYQQAVCLLSSSRQEG